MVDIKVNHPATAVFLGFLHCKVVLYNALLSMPFSILCSLQGSHYKLHTLQWDLSANSFRVEYLHGGMDGILLYRILSVLLNLFMNLIKLFTSGRPHTYLFYEMLYYFITKIVPAVAMVSVDFHILMQQLESLV